MVKKKKIKILIIKVIYRSSYSSYNFIFKIIEIFFYVNHGSTERGFWIRF